MAENSQSKFLPVTDIAHLDLLFADSSASPVVLFKHSVTCPISAGAYAELRAVSVPVHIVTVQTGRPISNAIEARTGVRHESPQVIVLRNGAPVWSASHWEITAKLVEDVVTNAVEQTA